MEPIKLIGMKKEPSQARGMDRVLAILDACESLLGQKRYDDISLEEIIDTANVAKGTLYHFFKNRRAVFLAAMHRALLDIDQQADPLPGEEKLDFADYVSKVESRLQAVWRKHSHLVEFYASNVLSPDYELPKLEQQRRSTTVMTEQLRLRHPEISEARARLISSVLLRAIYWGLDTLAVQPHLQKRGFQLEWRQMISSYIDSFTSPEA